MIVLFDIDGTLADDSNRRPLLARDPPDWSQYAAECDEDPLIYATADTLIAFHNIRYQIWLWTGRSDAVRDQTIQWLSKHALPYNQLLMRPHGDERKAETLKQQWLNTVVPKDLVQCAYDDNPGIIKMLTDNGITAYQVHQGV